MMYIAERWDPEATTGPPPMIEETGAAADRIRADFVRRHLQQALHMVQSEPGDGRAVRIYEKFREYVSWCAHCLSEQDLAEISEQMDELQSLLALQQRLSERPD